MFTVGIPEIPEKNDFTDILEKIWIAKKFTNFGEYLFEFEKGLCTYLEREHVITFSSGTAALEALISVLNKSGRVLLPPFTFVSTLTAVKRNKLKHQFVDVAVSDGTIDARLVDEANPSINDIILGVHCYGYPCEVSSLQDIANKTGASLIYDSAHCFGSKYLGRHLTNFGEASILSFHATKILNSVEGGAVVVNDHVLAEELRKFRNFGFNENKTASNGIGTNSKLSEIHAAMGLLQLKKFKSTLTKRRNIYDAYTSKLEGNINVRMLKARKESSVNGSYVPVTIKAGRETREQLVSYLQQNKIFVQPYFKIDLSSVDKGLTQREFGNTTYLTNRVLCLPIHSSMSHIDVEYIVSTLNEFFDKHG